MLRAVVAAVALAACSPSSQAPPEVPVPELVFVYPAGTDSVTVEVIEEYPSWRRTVLRAWVADTVAVADTVRLVRVGGRRS